jgi:hypothetical protein
MVFDRTKGCDGREGSRRSRQVTHSEQRGSGYKTVDYPSLVAPMIEAIKELKADNDNEARTIEQVNTPPPERRWLQITAQSRIGPPFGGLRSH